MNVIVDFCLIPTISQQGANESGAPSLSPYIAECQRILEEMGLEHVMHAFGTNIEGEWDTVMDAIKRCHNRVHEMGAPRISSTLKLGTRIDKRQSMSDKVAHVKALLNE